MKKRVPYIGLTTHFSGLRLAAGRLGVNEQHLRKVLNKYHGRKDGRESAVLLERVRKQFPALLGKEHS